MEFTDLKPVLFWDAVGFCIPEHWDTYRQADGHWGCYDEAHPATVWVDFKAAPFGEGNDLGEAVFPLERQNPNKITDILPVESHTYSIRPGHDVMNIMHVSDDDEFQGTYLRYSRWQHIHPREGGLMFCFLTLVMPETFANTKSGRRLAHVMHRELVNAYVNWDVLAVTDKQAVA